MAEKQEDTPVPKINVYPPGSTAGDGTLPTARLEVGWHPNGTLTVAARRRSPVTITAGGEHVTFMPESGPESGDDPDGWTGLFVDLDRAGANALIRALRTARDKAFGRDA